MKCQWSKCGAPAVYLAYTTVGMGDAHSCEWHAPGWLKAGRYSAYYSPVPCAKDQKLAQATARRLTDLAAGRCTEKKK